MRISDWSSDVCSSDLIQEPFASLFTQGMVTHETYSRVAGEGQPPLFFTPDEVVRSADGATLEADGAPVDVGRVIKMSKSKKNVVDPDAIDRKSTRLNSSH